MAATDLNVGKLAGAVAGDIRDHNLCHIEAVGPASCHKALKSLVMATRYLQDRGQASPEQSLVFVPSKVAIPASEDSDGGVRPETTMITFTIWLPSADSCDERLQGFKKPDIFAGRESNPGLLAGELAAFLKTRGYRGSAEMVAMGAASSSKALKAIIIARVYLADVLTEAGQTLAVVAGEETLRVSGDEKVRMVLSCRRLSLPVSASASS